MSWSIYIKGTPEEVIQALEKQGSNYLENDQSGEEYKAALPYLVALVKENIGGIINLSVYGHGTKNDGSFSDKSCQVNINR